ncbi:MAG: GreA/GreB family elongation factor [Verrucomicrobia bacterium]|nr:GreA/GreB family elongation factor [Verrucomicrobiota bacterium]
MSDANRIDNPPVEAQTEEWFLSQMANPNLVVGNLLSALRDLRESDRKDQAEQRIELLQDTLAERGKLAEALEALQQRARWAVADGRKDINWSEEALDVLGGEWEMKALIDESGFTRPGAAADAIGRLRLLLALREGLLVYDRTWGLGTVGRVDAFNKRVEIDFERRAGHSMSFSYAAESLALVDEDHLLMWRRTRLEELRKRVKDDAAEVVRMALRSFGPLTATQLQSTLSSSGIVQEADWKRFWDSARKKLKIDGSVLIPAGRSDLLRLQEGAHSQQDQQFDALSRERNLTKLIAALEELTGPKGPKTFTPSQQGILLDRLQFALKGAANADLATPARVAVCAAAFGIEDKLGDSRLPDFFQGLVLDNVLKQLPARPLRAFLRYLHTKDAEQLKASLLSRLAHVEISVLNEALTYLQETGHELEAAARFKQAFDARTPSLEMLSWLGRHPDRISDWDVALPSLVVRFMIESLEQDANGERLKAQNQLRERFLKPDWLKKVMPLLSQIELEQMLLRVKESTGWPALDRAAVMGQMIKLSPDLAPLLASRSEQVAAARGPVTSKRSFRERQQQLDHILSVEIPKVARDIALARSYGDLRENHEYKAAKEAQTILFRRRDELMQELRRVTPSDFRDFPADKAGVATTVTLSYEDGRQERYHILGAWDGDPSRGIISSTSRMAEALIGHAAGETLVVPSEDGEAKATLTQVAALPADLLAYISQE